ncbi:hypothetical protein AVEN_263589-1 [Araneus ventricosus]|uniref:Tc1-like transposase DDE domain-containing protein n=1 Tax=Araneus ventricosus TaxID=182803 RepID=A0A4Y2I164_ARAVE|nr:hypothetical protein AVEN_263589-1 [Araneus ventricosus]
MQPTDPKEFCRPLGKAIKTYEELPVAPFSSINVENMPHNIDRMVLSNDQKYLYDICLAISRGECYSDLALRKPGPVVHSRWLTIAGRILRLRSSVTAVRYRNEVLDPFVKLFAAAVGPSFVLKDDNVCPHRGAIVDDFLESEGIAHMEWLAYSLDLNPIENIWDALGRAVCRRFPSPATLRDLETALQEE